MNIKIKKGCHWRCNHLLTRLHIGRAWKRSYVVMFDASAQYHIMANRTQVNKLVGIGHVHHHLNSVRVGWRNTDENGLELVAYLYHNGDRSYKSIATNVAVNKPMLIDVEYKTNKEGYVQAEIRIDGISRSVDVWKSMKWWERLPVMYECLPYFGGLVPAPHDINLCICRR